MAQYGFGGQNVSTSGKRAITKARRDFGNRGIDRRSGVSIVGCDPQYAAEMHRRCRAVGRKTLPKHWKMNENAVFLPKYP